LKYQKIIYTKKYKQVKFKRKKTKTLDGNDDASDEEEKK
jgi:hypothetical protein